MDKRHLKRISLTGRRFGRLTVLAPTSNLGDRTRWSCACDCSAPVSVRTDHLLGGKTQSCGCHNQAVRRAQHGKTTHGMSTSREYAAWTQAKQRCYNETHRKYPDWGGRGIRMCERWLNSFENFFRDMGPRPSSRHSLDRKENDGNYEPDNCRWATRAQQLANRRPYKVRR